MSINTKKNYLYNVFCEVVTTLIPLITTPYVTRVLGTDGMGAYQYVMTIASYFVLFANFGVKAYGNRCIADVRDNKEKRDRTFSGIFCQQLALSFSMFLLYAAYVFTLGKTEYRTVFLVFGINLISAVLEITWLYYGMEAFAPVALGTIAIKLSTAAGIFLLVRSHDDLWIYAVLCSSGGLAVQLFLWCGARRFVRFVRVPFAEIRKHFLPCCTLLIPMIAPTLYRSMDKLMLEGMTGRDAVGLYSAAEQLQTCMLGFITGLGTVMLPRISNLLSHGKKEEAAAYRSDSMQFSMFIGCAFAFGIMAVSDVFVPYYYGAAFSEAAPLTELLSVTIVFIAWTDVIRSQFIIPHRRDGIFIVSVIVGVLINLTGNLIFIPYFEARAAKLGMTAFAAGTLGALPGTVLAEFSVPVVQYLFLRRELPYLDYLKKTAVFPLAGIAMLTAVRLTGTFLRCHGMGAGLSLLLIEIFAGGAVYLLITGVYYLCFRRETVFRLFSGNREQK